MPPTTYKSSTSVSVSAISPQSSSDLDTEQGEIIDKTIKQVVQTVNQTLLKTTTGIPTSNLNLSNTSHDKTPDRQSVPTLNQSDIHKHMTTPPNHTYRPDPSENSLTHPATNLEQAKQIIMDIDAPLHSPTLLHQIFIQIRPQMFVPI